MELKFVLPALLLIPTSCFSVKYFSFGNLDNDSPGHSFATLVSAPDESLPESFTLCSTHLQQKLDGRGFYYITDENNKPWLTFRWKLRFGKVDFKIYFGSQPPSILYVDDVDEIVPNNWYNVCLAVDIITGKISLAVNGRLLFQRMSLKDIPTPLKLSTSLKDRLHIGLWYHYGKSTPLEQFFGSVSNIQIHRGGTDTLENILKVACYQQGDFLAWENMKWKHTGKHVEENEIEQNYLCSRNTTLDVAFPVKQAQRDSVRTCQKLGHGSMRYKTSKTELTRFMAWFEGAVPEPMGWCRYIWTPFSDAGEEGHYVSLDIGEDAKFLPWALSMPIKGGRENAIAIDVSFGENPYMTALGDYLNCFACTVKANFSARIYGACHSSFIGRLI